VVWTTLTLLDSYYVCEKSDGVRCLLYFTRDENGEECHYLIDRKNDYYYVRGLHFPVPGDESFQNFHVDTLIDGELVNDKYPDGRSVLRYLVFDCLVLDGNMMMQRTLDKRLAYFREKVFKPWEHLCKSFPDEVQYFPFQVKFKGMEFSYSVEHVFNNILPSLPHGHDGMVFTCRTSPYQHGTDQKILKWKPKSENSIDFMLKLDFPFIDPDSEDEADGKTSPFPDYHAMPTFRLCVMHNNGDYRDFGEMYMTDQEWVDMKALEVPLMDQIIECAYDEQGRWRFLRFRNDKKDGNHISTVNSVLQSIADSVTEKELFAAAPLIRDAWKKRNAPPQNEQQKKAQMEQKARAEREAVRRTEEQTRSHAETKLALAENHVTRPLVSPDLEESGYEVGGTEDEEPPRAKAQKRKLSEASLSPEQSGR
jgi:mRNA guanylyltransferase